MATAVGERRKGKKSDQQVKTVAEGIAEVAKAGMPRSIAFAQRGVTTGSQFAGMMSALMSDILEGKVTPQVGNAVVNAGGKLLKVVEMQAKYGKTAGDSKVLTLTSDSQL